MHRQQWSLGRYYNYSKAKLYSLPTKATYAFLMLV